MIRNFDRSLPGLALALILAACGADGADLPRDAPEWLAMQPEPVLLDVTLDADRARSKRITPSGGTVTATGANGTRYSLRIPAGALLSDELITVTPVARLDGLPLQGDAFETVQLEPSGLRLLEAATLTVRSKNEVSAGEQVAFGYYGAGQDAHLTPILPDDRGRIRIPVLHFSGYGYGRAAPNDPGRLALQKAANHEARFTARVAEILDAARASGEDGEEWDGDGMYDAMIGAYIEYYDAVLEPLMRIAETDERMAQCALQRYTYWERALALMWAGELEERPPAAGTNEPERAIHQRRTEAKASAARIFETATSRLIDRAIERCRNEQDFTVVNSVISLKRQAALLGITDDARTFDEEMQEVWDCLTFEVEFRSVIERKMPTGGTYHHVTATVVHTPMTGEPQTAPLEYVAYRASGNPTRDLLGDAADAQTLAGAIFRDAEGVRSAAGTKPGTAQVYSVQWNYNPKEAPGTNCDGKDETRMIEVSDTLTIIMAPGIPIELMRLTPVRAGEQSELASGIQEGVNRMSGDPTLGAELESARVPGAMTIEETHWANEWERRHGTQAVRVEGADVRQEAGGAYRIVLPRVTKGVWRVEFLTEDSGDLSGFSTNENSHVIVRHTPK